MISTHDPGLSIPAMVGPHLLPAFYDTGEPNKTRFEAFIRDCIGLLASSNISVRESTKDALGSDLPIATAPIVFEQLHR